MTWKHVLILTLVAVYQMAGRCPTEAVLLAVDDFGGADSFVVGSGDYTAGADLVGQGPEAAGFSGEWVETVGGVNKYTVSATGLDIAAADYETGGSVTLSPAAGYAGNNVVKRTLIESESSDTYYFSGMLSPNVDSTGYTANGQQTFITFDSSDSVLNFGFRGQDGVGRVAFRAIDKSSPNYTPVTLREGYSAGEVLHYIIKAEVDGGLGDNDQLTFILNPTDISSEAQALATAETTLVTTDYDMFNAESYFNWVELNVNNMPGATITFDEIRFGTTFEKVAVPEPTMAVLLVFGVMAMLAGTRRRCR